MAIRTEKILKDTIVGLVYPAVLGNMLYLLIAAVVNNFVGLATGTPNEVSWLWSLKLCLLAITIAFYCCDYLYIVFTNDFHVSFFWSDLAFVTVLYVTVFAGIEFGTETPVRTRLILLGYLVFMGLYLRWDRFERRRCPEEERDLYDRIIRWEMWAIAGLLIGVGLTTVWRVIYVDFLVLFFLIGAITIPFWRYTLEKRQFVRENG